MAINLDVAFAKRSGALRSGYRHFVTKGARESKAVTTAIFNSRGAITFWITSASPMSPTTRTFDPP